jgi:hypothetical protein
VIRIVRTPRPAAAPADLTAQSAPWRLADLGRLARFEVPSLIAIVVCFVGARHTDNWGHQLYWIVGAIAAMLLAGAGWTAWLLVGARSLRRRQRRLGELTSLLVPPPTRPMGPDRLVTARGMTHFHRVGCLLTEGRKLTSGQRKTLVARGLTPCGVCLDE